MLPPWVERDELEWPQRRQETGSTPVQSTPASTSTQASTTTTTTSSTASTSTTSTTISTTSTSATSQTTSATISTTSAAPTSAPSSSSTTSRILSTRPDGGVVTLTSTVIGSAPSQTSSGGGGGGFFQNTAAVAAVFTIAGVIGLVLLFVLVTTCLRRRRERKFDRDVAEAAAAAAASNADPFFGDEDDRGAHWDPRRGSAQASGYGRIGEDPYATYAAPAAAAAAGTGFGRSATMHYQQQRNPQDAYSMNDMGSSGHPSSGYSNYNPSGNSYYIDQPQVDYSRPSFGSGVVPGIAGVGSGGAMAAAGAQQQQYNQDNQNLRYRGQQQSSVGAAEDPYGGYTTVGVTSDGDRYPNPYATPPASTAYSLSPNRRSTNVSPPLPAVPPSQSPPPPPSYTGHGPTLPEKARPLSASHNAPSMPGPSQPHALGPGTPDESYNDGGRILRVANE